MVNNELFISSFLKSGNSLHFCLMRAVRTNTENQKSIISILKSVKIYKIIYNLHKINRKI